MTESLWPKTVLVVDDEPSIRRLVQLTLESDGWDVHTAESTADAIEVLRAMDGPPTAAVLDIMMPGADGVALGGIIGEVLHPPPVILYLTAKTDEATLQRAVILGGASDYLTKPFDPVTLTDRLESFCAEAGRPIA